MSKKIKYDYYSEYNGTVEADCEDCAKTKAALQIIKELFEDGIQVVWMK